DLCRKVHTRAGRNGTAKGLGRSYRLRAPIRCQPGSALQAATRLGAERAGWQPLLWWCCSGLSGLSVGCGGVWASAAPLSNGNTRMIVDMAKHAGLPWDAVLGADLSWAYKPMPRAYLRACELFGVAPGQAMLIAAHDYDLEA